MKIIPKPRWLPDPIRIDHWDHKTYDVLYEIFKIDFIKTRPLFRGRKIFVPLELEDGKEKVFWHLTSQMDKKLGERYPDIKRSERIVWIKYIIENADEKEVLNFNYNEDNHTVNNYLWLYEHDFVVILRNKTIKKKHATYKILITAYYLDYPFSKRRMIKKYENRQK